MIQRYNRIHLNKALQVVLLLSLKLISLVLTARKLAVFLFLKFRIAKLSIY